MTPSIGRIKKVDIRKMWESEAAFTKWLAENIDYLNEKVNLDITVQKSEKNVGPYRVDIYGEDGSGNKVIIENQLEKTDHTHLGQILTYLVNLDANIAIWITTNPIEEHRQVIEWLNETTPDSMYFYLIKVEGINMEGQPFVAPLFTVIEGPTEEQKKIGAEKKEYAKRHIVREKFWAQFIEAMNQKNNLCQNINPGTDAWISIAMGMAGVSLNLVVTGNYVRSEIYINRGDIKKNKEIFDYFEKSKKEIEKNFGGPLVWERMEDRVTSRIKHQLDNVDIFNEEDWSKMNAFLIDSAMRMHKVFREYVQRLRTNH